MEGDLVVFTQPRGTPVDSRDQPSLTCRLTSEPDTMGTSWPGFCHLSRLGIEGGAQDLLRRWMAWAVDSKYLFYDAGITR